MRTLRMFGILALVLTVGACSSAKYNFDYAPQANFAAYETYAWFPGGNNLPPESQYNNDMIDNRLMDAIDYALNAKGLRKVDAREADVFVVYHAIVDQRQSYNTVNNYYGYDPYWGAYGAWGGWGGGTSTTYVTNYEEGTVIVDLLENAAGNEERLVWRTSVTDTLKDYNDPVKRREEMRATALRMFDNYPPGGGS